MNDLERRGQALDGAIRLCGEGSGSNHVDRVIEVAEKLYHFHTNAKTKPVKVRSGSRKAARR